MNVERDLSLFLDSIIDYGNKPYIIHMTYYIINKKHNLGWNLIM